MHATLQLQDVKDRIVQLGFVVSVTDEPFLNFQITKTVKYALAQINQNSIPNQLYEALIDMVVGEFLLIQQALGKLDDGSGGGGGGIVTAKVAEVRDGDTTVKYADESKSGGGGSIATGFDGLLEQLLQPGYDWQQWRKMRWC